MQNNGSKIPDFSLGYHSRWEVELHRVEQECENKNEVFTYEDRKRTVERIIRANPQTAGDVVRCDICQEKFAEALIQNKNVWECPQAARETLESYGFRMGGRKIMRVQGGTK